MRCKILAAAGAVYAVRGFRGTTVARIAERAGLSKPTFYSFFDSASDAVVALAKNGQSELLAELGPMMVGEGDLLDRLAGGIDAYLDDSTRNADAWLVFHVEQHDPSSPARQLRTAHDATLIASLRHAVSATGRPAPTDEALRLLMGCMQTGCYQYLTDPACDRNATRRAMLRSALGIVGTAADWRTAAARPDLFDTPEVHPQLR